MWRLWKSVELSRWGSCDFGSERSSRNAEQSPFVCLSFSLLALYQLPHDFLLAIFLSEVRYDERYFVLLIIYKPFYTLQGVLTDTRGCTQTPTRTNAATAQRLSVRLVKSQYTREFTLAPSLTPAPTAARASGQPPSGWCTSDLTLRWTFVVYIWWSRSKEAAIATLRHWELTSVYIWHA